MAYRTLLVHVDNSRQSIRRIEFAADLACRIPAHLSGIYLPFHPPGFPDVTRSAGAGLPPPPVPDSDTHRLREAQQQFTEISRRHGLAYEWLTPPYEANYEMRTRARYADLVIAGQEDRRDAESSPVAGFVESVVLGGGRPVLILPYAGSVRSTFERILIAWDGSREAARAAADAMPLLRAASTVHVMQVSRGSGASNPGPAPGMDIATFFARHGVNVELSAGRAVDEIDVGDVLLSRANDMNIGLLVMGGYGHSRLQEWALGGVTRTVLQSMTVPVLMSH